MSLKQSMRALIERHGHWILNVYLFLTLGFFAVWRAWQSWTAQQFNWVEAFFFTHNVILVLVILVRSRHVAMDRSIWRQAVALIAFFSGIAFDDRPTVESPALLRASQCVTVFVMVVGSGTLINLGRSFGILIAKRKIETRGLYSVVRHPMYATDILWRAAFILQNPSLYNCLVAGISVAAYVYRALLEERFLARYAEYREYMGRVRYRFIPGIF